MKLKYIILYVDNVRKSLDFYQAAFGFTERMIHGAGDYGELETGDTVIAFSTRALMKELGKNPTQPSAHSPSFEIAFETETVDKAFEKATSAGAESIQVPTEMPWGQTVSYVADRDGFLVEICSPVKN